MNKEMHVPLLDSARNTFLEQMIPHHANAVNMAKLLLKTNPDPVADTEGIEDIVHGIINTQNYQIHAFRNILESDATMPHDQCRSADGTYEPLTGRDKQITGSYQGCPPNVPSCVPSATNLCMSLDTFASETGYYNFAGYMGSSPTIRATIGQTYTFDQSDPSNWYHPVGFAYEPDGAHGSTWGGAELDEVEGLGELLYKIDGAPTTCADAGDTGLDCYEPEVRQLAQPSNPNHYRPPPAPCAPRAQAPHLQPSLAQD